MEGAHLELLVVVTNLCHGVGGDYAGVSTGDGDKNHQCENIFVIFCLMHTFRNLLKQHYIVMCYTN